MKNLTPADFWFDGGVRVHGWTDGDEWNGWGVPLFDEAELREVIQALSDAGFRVQRRGSTLRLTHEDDDHHTDYRPETHRGQRYWRIDGLTWNYQRGWRPAPKRRLETNVQRRRTREAEHTAAIGWNGIEWIIYGIGDDEDEAAADARNSWTETPWLTFVPISEAQIAAMGDHGEENRCAVIDLDVGNARRRMPAYLRETTARERDRPLTIKGWAVGYDDSISAHAATRSPKKYWLFVMTTPEDREPRSLDEEVTVGLYHLNEDGDWEQIAWQDFPSVSSVIELSDPELQINIEHGITLDVARQTLEEDFSDLEDGVSDTIYSWMKLILKDAGVTTRDENAASEAIEQIRNASPAQILEYMTARAEAMLE